MWKPQNNKRQTKIKPLHELSEDEKNHLRRSGNYIPIIKPIKPTFWKRLRDNTTKSIKKAISFDNLGKAVNASVLIGAITFIAGEQNRRDAQVYQAWQVINSAHNQPGSGGRIQALEFLNSTPRRIPWFWLHWQSESLSGLEAPNAYLVPSRPLKEEEERGIQLSEANLEGANLQGANLEDANLKMAHMESVNLQEAKLNRAKLQRSHLKKVDLQAAHLVLANLQQAYLNGANLQKADLAIANLQGVVTGPTKRHNANQTNLQGARLFGADLQGALLSNANLQGANLNKAKYTDENTSENTCKELKLIYDDLDEEYPKNKPYPCPTSFPEGFDPEAAGMLLIK